jgi:hypothetical protein
MDWYTPHTLGRWTCNQGSRRVADEPQSHQIWIPTLGWGSGERIYMRIFVATLYSGENELNECKASVLRQTYRNHTHRVFKHLPNRSANAHLFMTFKELAGEYDLFVRLDADMVIARDDLFEGIVDTFKAQPQVKVLVIAVRDFISDQLMIGLAAYRSNLAWPSEFREDLFTDAVLVQPGEILVDWDRLAPASYHCPNPSDLQCLHYGIQRALKVTQPRQQVKRPAEAKAHWETLERTWSHFLRTGDRRVGLACLGAELAFSGKFGVEHLDYSDPTLGETARRYEGMDGTRLERLLRRLRAMNFGMLPGRSRRSILSYIRGGNLLDWRSARDALYSLRWGSSLEPSRTGKSGQGTTPQ